MLPKFPSSSNISIAHPCSYSCITDGAAELVAGGAPVVGVGVEAEAIAEAKGGARAIPAKPREDDNPSHYVEDGGKQSEYHL